jgi:transcriptional regulator with XRE-family HTH domain
MKTSAAAALPPTRASEATLLGQTLSRLRLARNIKQETAALRAGLSRNTAYRLEKGDPGIAIGHLLRYLEAIAPGKSLLNLLEENDPALLSLQQKERRHRVRDLSAQELKELDF